MLRRYGSSFERVSCCPTMRMGGDGGYTGESASYCRSNLKSVSGHDKPSHDKPCVDRSRRRDHPRPVLGTDRPVRMVRTENGRVDGRLLKVVSETRVDPPNISRVLPGLPVMRIGRPAISV